MRTMLFKLPVIIASFLVFGGCVKEKCSRTITYKIYTPVSMAKADYLASIKAEAPREIGTTGKIYVKDQYIYVNELYKGIHVIDNSNPRSPKNVAFVNIMGNVDLAIKDNTLYADSYGSLAVFNISDPLHITLTRKIDSAVNYMVNSVGLMMGQSYLYKDSIVVEYTSRDTAYTCDCTVRNGGAAFLMSDNSGAGLPSSSFSAKSGSSTGKGGSMARFTIAKDHLYTVNWAYLKTYDISDAPNPVSKGEQVVAGGIETIFPFGEHLYIGSTSALFIYDIINPAVPKRRSSVSHFRACDPVVVEGTTAYVTIRSGVTCGGTFNQLLVFDVSNVDLPVKLATYDLKNPHGLGVNNGRLFICEGVYGLRFMTGNDVTKIATTKLLGGLDAYDVISYDAQQRLLVSAADGLYQYDYSAMNNPVLLSKINAKNRL